MDSRVSAGSMPVIVEVPDEANLNQYTTDADESSDSDETLERIDERRCDREVNKCALVGPTSNGFPKWAQNALQETLDQSVSTTASDDIVSYLRQ